MSLYNMKSTDQAGIFTITKFDDDLNVESSYPFHNTTDGFICHCPAGQRPTCRHRQMFPMLQTRIDTAWMLDFDTRQWVDPTGEASNTNSMGPELTATQVNERIKNYAGPLPGDSIIQEMVDRSIAALGPQGSLGSSPSTNLSEVTASSVPSPQGVQSLQVGQADMGSIPTELHTETIRRDDSHPFRRRM